jgi:heptosyltransferase II
LMSKPARKVLIIKTGYSEFLDRGISTTVSLGDVLICTSLLHLYKEDHVTWVTSHQARELLEDNPFIHELLIFGTDSLDKLRAFGPFDILINLEKDIGLCAVVGQLKATKRYGFYFSDKTHNIETWTRSTGYLLAGQENQRDIEKNALEILYETVGKPWEGQGLILAHKSKVAIEHDFGFNHAVGSKWPTKAWPMAHWKELERVLKPQHSISWQEGHTNLSEYIDWINSCRVIVTSDSLGQAIGSALGKKVITLYGPTNYQRMKNVPNVQVVPSMAQCDHMPCYLPFCKQAADKFCMDHISPEKVANLCREAIAEEIVRKS